MSANISLYFCSSSSSERQKHALQINIIQPGVRSNLVIIQPYNELPANKTVVYFGGKKGVTNECCKLKGSSKRKKIFSFSKLIPK